MVLLVLVVGLLTIYQADNGAEMQREINNEVKWAFYIGDFSFALTGAITAGQTGMDLLGCIIIAWVVATGGATLPHTHPHSNRLT